MFQNSRRTRLTICRCEFACGTPSSAATSHPLHLEREAQPELEFTLGESGCEAKRLARREGCAPMHVERGESRCQTEDWAHLIVHTRKVCTVGDVEAFGCKLQFGLLANFMLPTQAHIEIDVVRA